MRLICASAIAGDWPSVNGAGGNTSSADAPPCAAMREMRAASMLPSAQMPFTSGLRRRVDPPVRPDAVHQRQARADLILRDLKYTLLLIEAARSDFSRVRVDGDRGQAFHGRAVAQMLAEAGLIDREIVVEWQKNRRNYAVRDISLLRCHEPLPFEIATTSIIQTTSAPPSI